MIVVIQCAGRKSGNAGTLRQSDGLPVMFVANPKDMQEDAERLYAHPDDISESGVSWRRRLLDYNRDPGANPLGLLPAWKLYQHPVYGRLVRTYSVERVHILSAGWGLIPAEFLTPDYNITFSANGGRGTQRNRTARYQDLCLLPQEPEGPMVYFGGKSYLPLFCELTRPFDCRKVVFYNSEDPPHAPGCELKRFTTTTRTNWHYQCANDFIDGKVGV